MKTFDVVMIIITAMIIAVRNPLFCYCHMSFVRMLMGASSFKKKCKLLKGSQGATEQERYESRLNFSLAYKYFSFFVHYDYDNNNASLLYSKGCNDQNKNCGALKEPPLLAFTYRF